MRAEAWNGGHKNDRPSGTRFHNDRSLLVGDSNGDYVNHRVIESFTESQKVTEWILFVID